MWASSDARAPGSQVVPAALAGSSGCPGRTAWLPASGRHYRTVSAHYHTVSAHYQTSQRNSATAAQATTIASDGHCIGR